MSERELETEDNEEQKRLEEIREILAREDQASNSVIEFLNRIGASGLAREVDEQKLAVRTAQSEANIQYWQLSMELWRLKEERVVEDEIAILSALFDKSSTYNTVILSLGYAGFFAAWAIVAGSMTTEQNALIGILLGVSLITFVIWTLLTSIAVTLQIRARAHFINRDFESRQHMLDEAASLSSKLHRPTNLLQRLWPPVFAFVALTGLAAGVLLIAALVEQTVGLTMTQMLQVVANMIRD